MQQSQIFFVFSDLGGFLECRLVTLLNDPQSEFACCYLEIRFSLCTFGRITTQVALFFPAQQGLHMMLISPC
jgi:hypothetical protein